MNGNDLLNSYKRNKENERNGVTAKSLLESVGVDTSNDRNDRHIENKNDVSEVKNTSTYSSPATNRQQNNSTNIYVNNNKLQDTNSILDAYNSKHNTNPASTRLNALNSAVNPFQMDDSKRISSVNRAVSTANKLNAVAIENNGRRITNVPAQQTDSQKALINDSMYSATNPFSHMSATLRTAAQNVATQDNQPQNTVDWDVERKLTNNSEAVMNKLTGNDGSSIKQKNQQRATDYIDYLNNNYEGAQDYLNEYNDSLNIAEKTLINAGKSYTNLYNSTQPKNNRIDSPMAEANVTKTLQDQYHMSESEARYWASNYGTLKGILDNKEAEETRNAYIKNYSSDIITAMNDYVKAKRDLQFEPENTVISKTKSHFAYLEAKKKLEEMGINPKDKGEYQLLYEYMDANYGAEENEQIQSYISNLVEKYPATTVALNLYDVGMSPVSGLMATAGTIFNDATKLDKTQPSDTNSAWYMPQNISTAIQNATNEEIERTADKFNVSPDVGEFAYGVGSSTAKSLYSMALGGNIGQIASTLGASSNATRVIMQLATLPSFGGTAYASTLQEQLDKGLGQEQAQAYAIVAGINEMLYEELSLDKAYGIYTANSAGKVSWQKTIMNMLAQAGIEGSEEVFTELSNRFADAIINTDFSQHNINVRQYMEMGYTQAQAEEIVKQEELKQLLETFFAGAISGGITGVVTTVAGANKYKSTAQNIKSDATKTQALYDKTKANAIEGTTARDIVDSKTAEELTENDISNILESLAESGKSNEEFLTEVFIEAGETEESAQELAKQAVLATESNLGAMSEEKASKIEDNTAKAYENDNFTRVMQDYSSGKIQNPSTIAQVAMQVAKNENNAARAEKIGHFIDSAKNKVNTIADKVSGRSNSFVIGNTKSGQVGVMSFDDVSQNKAIVNTNKGKMDITKIDLGRSNEAMVLKTAADYENTKAANILMNDYTGQDIQAYISLSRLAYNLGQNGQPFATLLNDKSVFVQNSLEELKDGNKYNEHLLSMYKAGLDTRSERSVEKVNAEKANAVQNKLDVAKDDKLYDFKSVIRDYTQANVLTDYAESRFNAAWITDTATLKTSANATNEYAAIVHEMFEFSRAMAPKEYEALKQAVLELAHDKLGYAEVQNAIKQYQNAYRTAGIESEAKKTLSEATDEFVNDFMAGAFSTESGAQQFIEHVANNDKYSANEKASIFQSFVDWVNHLLDTIKEFLTGKQQLGAKKALELEKMGVSLENIRDMALKAMDAAKVELNSQLMNDVVSEDNSKAEDFMGGELYSENDIEEASKANYSLSFDEPLMKAAIKENGRKDSKRNNANIDVVIPFHLVRTGKDIAAAYGYKDYKSQQEDKKNSAWDKEKNLKSIPPTVHANDRETYFKALEENNLKPRFEQYKGHPNYMKLVNETRMSYKDMKPVQPIFDLDEVRKELARIPKEGAYGLLKGIEDVETQDRLLEGYVDEAVKKIQALPTKESFSLDVPVEKTDKLIALHNLTEDQLIWCIENGGFPAPSIAVIKSNMAHSKYGETSVLFTRDSIDPQIDNRNKIYGADAYTPTVRAVGYEIKNSAVHNFEDKLRKISENVEDYFSKDLHDFFGYYTYETATDQSVDDTVKRFSKNKAVQAAYLEMIGKHIDAIKKEAEKKYDPSKSDMYDEIIESYGKDTIEKVRYIKFFDWKDEQDLSKAISILKKYSPELFEGKLHMEALKGYRAISEAYAYMNDNSSEKTYVYNNNAMDDKLEAEISKVRDDYEAWFRKEVESFYGRKGIRNKVDYMTNDGTRRTYNQLYYEFTPENIVRAMYERQKSRAEGAYGLVGNGLQSAAATEYKTIDEARNDSSRLMVIDDLEYQALVNRVSDKIKSISNEIESKYSKELEAGDYISSNIGDAFIDAATSKRTLSGVKKAFKNDFGISLTDDIAQKVIDVCEDAANIPTGYFEAKPERVVLNSEIAKVVIPDSASRELIKALNENNVPYEVYESGNEDQRAELVNDDNAAFSINVDSEGNKLSEQQISFFENSVIRNDEGKLMPMYHGTQNGGFTVFDAKKARSNGHYGSGFYFSSTPLTAYSSGDVYKVYLNITNPVSQIHPSKTITNAQLTKYVQELADNEEYGIEGYGQSATVKTIVNELAGKDNDFRIFNDVNATCVGDFAQAVKVFNEVNGTNFDGIEVFTETVAFNPEQIKLTTNENPTENQDIRYSVDVDNKGNNLTENQAEYFKDSKVRDDDGNLLVMYHGTDSYNEFTVFKKGKYGYLGSGIYLSSDENYAKRYATQNGYEGRIYTTYVNAVNPLVVTSDNPAVEILGEKVAAKRALKNSYSTRWITPADIKKLQSKGYDGIIWKYGKSPIEVSVWDANQVKNVDNLNPTSNDDIRYSIDVGYHAGDLGKAEPYSSQSYSRGTGHFGTGTYFVGDIERIKGYNDRNGKESPKESVDFSNYNLYRPFNYDEGMRLHQALKVLDGDIIKKDWIQHAANDELSVINKLGWHDLLKEKYGETYDIDMGISLVNPEAYEGSNYTDTIKEYADSIGVKYDSFEEWKDSLSQESYAWYKERNLFEDYYKDYLKETIEEYADEENKAYKLFLDAYRDLYFTAAWNKDINKAMNITADYVESMKDKRGNTADSTATVFMKALGYEGIDVRGIDGLDNTAYGSVIYDLKGKDLERKNEIGTARFSIDVGDENFNAAIQEMMDDISGGVDRLANNMSKVMDFKSDISKRMISNVAKNIKKIYGSDIKSKDLEEKLMRMFNYLRETGSINAKDIELIRTSIGEQVVDSMRADDPAAAAEYDKFVSGIKTWDIALDEGQMQEVKNKFDSYYGFKRYMAGKLSLNKNGTLLDDIWTEICDLSGGALSYGTNPNNQPIALAEYINKLEPKARILDEQSYEEASMSVALEVFRQFFNETSKKDAAEFMRDEIKEYNKAVKQRYQKLYNEALKEVEKAKAAELERLQKEYENLTIEEQAAMAEGIGELESVQIQQLKEDTKKRIDELKKQNNEAIAKVKADYRNRKLTERANRAWIDTKRKLVKEIESLQNMLAHPKEAATKHVPIHLVLSTIDLLEAIQMDTGRNKAITERLAKLASVYESYKTDLNNDDGTNYGFDYDERIAADIAEVKAMFDNGRFYTDLYTPEMERLLEIVRALKTQIKNANNLIIDGQVRDARDVALDAITEVKNSRTEKKNNVTDALDRYGNQHLNPYRLMRKLSGYTDGAMMKLYDNLEEGGMREMQIQQQLNDIYKDVLEGSKNQKEIKRFISTKPNDLVDIGIVDETGKSVKVSRAMRMSIIMHSFNENNMRHILYGGLTIPDMKVYSQNKSKAYSEYGDVYRFLNYKEYLQAVKSNDKAKQNKMLADAKKKVDALQDDLSEWEKKFLADAKKMFHEETGRLINDTSIALKGYTIARVKNYFPIKTDTDFTPTDFAGLVQNGTIEGMGMLKERVTSKKPMMLEDITDVIQRQIRNTSKYAAYAIPVRNFKMAMRQTFKDKRGEGTTLEKNIRKVWNAQNVDNLRNMLTAIETGKGRGEETFKVLNKIRANFAGAVLSINPSVAIKQAASYPTAAAVVGYLPLIQAVKDMPKGFAQAKGIEELEKRNPLLWYRAQGYGSQDLADAKASSLINKLPTKLQKALGWTQFMDTGTVRTLEYASKHYVDNNFKSLEKGSDAYWNKVSEVFTQVVTETQPNYDTLHKATIIRDGDSLAKMLVMFKTQPMQNFGILYDALGELDANINRYNKDKSASNKAKVKDSVSKFAYAVTSQLMSAVTFSAMSIIARLALHKIGRYRDDDDEWSWLTVLKEFGEGVVSCLTGMLLGGSEIYETATYYAGKNKYYSGIEVSSVEALNDFTTNTKYLVDATTNLWEAKTTAERDEASQKIAKYSVKVGNYAGQLLGIPTGNIYNIIQSIYLYGVDAVTSVENGKLTFSSKTDVTDWEVATQYERMYDAVVNDDMDEYNKLVTEMINTGREENYIVGKVKSMIKDEYFSESKDRLETIENLVDIGFSEAEASHTVNQWYTGYKETNEYGPTKTLIRTAADDPSDANRKAVVEEVRNLIELGKTKDNFAKQLKQEFKDEYNEGDNKVNLNSILRQALVAAGYSDTEAADILKSWLD